MKKKTKEEIQEKLNDKWGKDFYILTGEYKGSKIQTTFFCSRCNKEVLAVPEQMTLRGCPECGKNRRREKTVNRNKNSILTSEDIKKKFDLWNVNNTWELLNIYPDINGSNGNFKIEVKCKDCGFVSIQGYQSIFKKSFYCKYCEGRHISLQEAQNRLNSKFHRNIQIIQYNGWDERGILKCEKHNNEFERIPKHSYRQKLGGCKLCDIDNKTGDKNGAWQRGKTVVFNRLRNSIDSWLYDSYQFYDNKCIITNSNQDLIIHHFIKSFKDIVEETVNEFGYSYEIVRKEIGEFETNGIKSTLLKDLENSIRRKHYAIGYGVPLNKKIHNEFHSKYGRVNNSIDQLIEFAKEKRIDLKFENGKLIQIN